MSTNPTTPHPHIHQNKTQPQTLNSQTPESHELQSLSSPDPVHHKDGDGKQKQSHSFKPSKVDEGLDGQGRDLEGPDREDVRLPGGRKVWKKEVRWWERNIARVLPVGDDVRDHFALERTFLAYIRTSNALASLSVAIYQLSRLSSPAQSTHPSPPRIRKLERAATLLMMTGAVLVTLVGCARFLVGQKKVENGKYKIGGFDFTGLGGWLGIIEIVLFVIIVMN